MAQENKVFDVANPGSSKPDTGAKPMVVGHKHMLDPTLTGPIESESASSQPLSSRREKTLSPEAKSTNDKLDGINDVESSSVIASDEKIEVTIKTIVESEDEPAVEMAKEPEAESIEELEQTAEEKQKSEDDLGIAREDKLQEMIKSKEYYAPINEASLSSFGSFFKTFTVVVLLGIVVLIILIDAGIMDVGINLPFDLL